MYKFTEKINIIMKYLKKITQLTFKKSLKININKIIIINRNIQLVFLQCAF